MHAHTHAQSGTVSSHQRGFTRALAQRRPLPPRQSRPLGKTNRHHVAVNSWLSTSLCVSAEQQVAAVYNEECRGCGELHTKHGFTVGFFSPSPCHGEIDGRNKMWTACTTSPHRLTHSASRAVSAVNICCVFLRDCITPLPQQPPSPNNPPDHNISATTERYLQRESFQQPYRFVSMANILLPC